MKIVQSYINYTFVESLGRNLQFDTKFIVVLFSFGGKKVTQNRYVKITYLDSVTLFFLLNIKLWYQSKVECVFLKSVIAFLYILNHFEDIKKNVKCLLFLGPFLK